MNFMYNIYINFFILMFGLVAAGGGLMLKALFKSK